MFSLGNPEQGWITAPGMQGVEVQPFTSNMLTPESLAELMGGPDIAPSPSGPADPAGPAERLHREHLLPLPYVGQPGHPAPIPPPPPGPA